MIDDLVLKLEHYSNPLHIYCRLRDFKVSKSYAIRLSRLYENIVYRPLKKLYVHE
jgi:hypothetical protein